jgi:hypothetical protein
MTDAFTIKNYSILTSFNGTHIYLKLMDTVTHMVYETNVDNTELRLSLTLDNVYKIITSCFAEDAGYKVAITVRAGVMKMKFHAIIAGFLKVDFDILVKEKLMTNDAQLTLFVNQLEQKYENAIEALSDRCDELGCLVKKLEETISTISCAEIEMRVNTFVPLNTTTLSLQGDIHLKADKIKLLFKLQKLHLTAFSLVDLATISNSSLKDLYIDAGGSTKFVSLRGIGGMPKLESLVIANAPLLRDLSCIYKMSLRSIKIVGQCAVNMNELKSFCSERNIELKQTEMLM